MSQADSKTKNIDGTNYEVLMLRPKTARKILVRIFKVLAPSAGQAFNLESQELTQAIGPILSTLSDKLSDDDLDWMMSELAAVTNVEIEGGKEPLLSSIFDIHFRGRIGHMLKWFAFAMESQYSDFFGSSGEGLSGLLATIKAAVSQSPSTSTGLSGDQ